MTPEQGVFLLQSIFLPVYTAEHPVTKAVIAAMPPDKTDCRPDSIARNAIDLAWHIVVAEDQSLNPSPGAVVDLLEADGGRGAVDLRRELRRTPGARAGGKIRLRRAWGERSIRLLTVDISISSPSSSQAEKNGTRASWVKARRKRRHEERL